MNMTFREVTKNLITKQRLRIIRSHSDIKASVSVIDLAQLISSIELKRGGGKVYKD